MASKSTFYDYEGFVDKFKPKKTTDDCYTPPVVYDAVRGYVFQKYALAPETPIVRPFFPEGDYESADYPDDCVIIDNPPFSIISQICKFYKERGIKYFLFAPTLTLLSIKSADNLIIVNALTEYENDAKVNTSFVSNLGQFKIETDLKLKEIIEKVQAKESKALPKYQYPDEVFTIADGMNFVKNGVVFQALADECFFVGALDSQKTAKKSIFGGGCFLSNSKAKAEAKAEAKAIVWQLSDREKFIISELSKRKVGE
jgi:hypothetical protein